MPRGIFLLLDDPIEGLKVKHDYYTNPIETQTNFFPILFTSHTEFENESILEHDFDDFKIISYAPRYTVTKNTKAGVLGLVLEYYETSENLELFLRRNLLPALKSPNNEMMKEIFENRLQKYMLLNQLFDKNMIENISEILIIRGNSNYQSTILHLGEKQLSRLDIAILYKRMMKKSKIPNFKYFKLKNLTSNIYLVVKFNKGGDEIYKIFRTIKKYLEKNFNFSLEIIALFLLAPVITLKSSNQGVYELNSDKTESILKFLFKSRNYGEDFDHLISSLVERRAYLSSTVIYE